MNGTKTEIYLHYRINGSGGEVFSPENDNFVSLMGKEL